MPRAKPSAPRRMSDGEREANRWRMGDGEEGGPGPSSATQAGLFLENDDSNGSEDDSDASRPGPSAKVAKMSKKKGKSHPQSAQHPELQTLLDSKFYISVQLRSSAAKKTSADCQGSEWVGVIGNFEFLMNDRDDDEDAMPMNKLVDEDEFRIYLSDVPGMSFAYFTWYRQGKDESKRDLQDRRKKGKDPDGMEIVKLRACPSLDLLEAFGPSVKRRFMYLHLQENTPAASLRVSVVVTDSSLLRLSHPSDIVPGVPTCVKRVLGHLFPTEGQSGVSAEMKVEEEEEEEEEETKPNIDELYEVIKKSHEERNYANVEPQHPSLLPALRPYQKMAVKWMISQERTEESEESLHSLYKEVRAFDGTPLYYNRLGGFLVKERPVSLPHYPGGILADEMGLGKTVEVLSLMLCNPRGPLALPDFLEPIEVKKAKKRKMNRNRRSPSPVEFLVSQQEEKRDLLDNVTVLSKSWAIEKRREEEDEGTSSARLMQLDGNDDEDYEDETSDDEYVPRPSKSRRQEEEGDESNSSTDEEEQVEEERRTVSLTKATAAGSKRGSKARTKSAKPPKKKTKTTAAKLQVFSKKSKKKAPPQAAAKADAFDPASILNGRKVSKKSKMADMILDAVVTLSKIDKKTDGGGGGACSLPGIKKYMSDQFGKSGKAAQAQMKKSISKLVSLGQLVRTSSSSFKINPEFNSFDSRGIYADLELDSVDRVIEDVITEHCYEGNPFSKEEAKQKAQKHLTKPKDSTPAVYQRLKSVYDQSLSEMSEAMELHPEVLKYRQKMNRAYFNTKVEQTDYFECLCGSELPENEDDKYRVQCTDCHLWQHAECVRYDLSDPYRGNYVCPHCWSSPGRPPVESGATLIVSPATIAFQWIQEIQKHIRGQGKDLKVLFYRGTKLSGYIQPRDLARYDIVVTTYTVLQSETNYVDLPHSNSAEGRRFRNPKRFMALPAPLPCVQWWRVCLDEAQLIESTTAKTAEMALRLSAVNRWCVTGTPIEKSLNDLRGLLMFLRADPYCLQHWWKECLFAPYCRGDKAKLEEVVSSLLWRSAKKDVLEQIDIPEQTEEVHWLSFSPVEEHFYRRLHIDSSRDAVARIRRQPDLDARLSQLDRNSLATMLNPLVRLRQSCNHPQAVRGEFINLGKEAAMTMEDLLEQMIKKAVVECEEAHRQVIAALNGQAGIAIIEENWPEAVTKYREVLRIVQEYQEKIKTDTLQKYHTFMNLAEILESGHKDIDPTLRDDKLRDEAREMQEKYLAKYINGVRAANEALVPISQQVEDLRQSFKGSIDKVKKGDEAWYVAIVNSVGGEPTVEEDLLKLVREEMAQFFDVVNAKEFKQIEIKYSSSRVVMYKIAEKVAEFDGMRDSVCEAISNLQNSPPETFLHDSVDCHLRVSGAYKKDKKSCQLCLVHEDIELYESIIFHFVREDAKALKRGEKARATITSDDYKKLEEKGVYLLQEQRQGTWGDSETERLLRALLKFARQKSLYFNDEVLEDGSTHLKLLETMKKEFKLLRILWRQVFDHVAGVDEINMSVMRLRLRFEDEPTTSQSALKRTNSKKMMPTNLATRQKDKLETIYILEKYELPNQKLKLASEQTIGNSEFRKKFGQLQYLENLKKSDYAKQGGGVNPETCPICVQVLGKRWSVLQCGHSFCVECIRRLMKEFSSVGNNQRFRCPICRNSTYHAEISFVNTEAAHDPNKKDAEETLKAYEAVKGSWSTKVKSVIQTLIRINCDDPDAKSLVFSSWPDVLDILGAAMIENNIQYASLHAPGKFKRNLDKFKNREDVRVLLLPISSGSHGLNLTEASHVLLVEPLLNPAQELQAVGRVHRIGQKKETVVHRFVIRSTIEERIHKMVSTFQTDENQQGLNISEENLLSLRDLKNIFVDEDNEDGGV